jgi:hypothetical protein
MSAEFLAILRKVDQSKNGYIPPSNFDEWRSTLPTTWQESLDVAVKEVADQISISEGGDPCANWLEAERLLMVSAHAKMP